MYHFYMPGALLWYFYFENNGVGWGRFGVGKAKTFTRVFMKVPTAGRRDPFPALYNTVFQAPSVTGTLVNYHASIFTLVYTSSILQSIYLFIFPHSRKKKNKDQQSSKSWAPAPRVTAVHSICHPLPLEPCGSWGTGAFRILASQITVAGTALSWTKASLRIFNRKA